MFSFRIRIMLILLLYILQNMSPSQNYLKFLVSVVRTLIFWKHPDIFHFPCWCCSSSNMYKVTFFCWYFQKLMKLQWIIRIFLWIFHHQGLLDKLTWSFNLQCIMNWILIWANLDYSRSSDLILLTDNDISLLLGVR